MPIIEVRHLAKTFSVKRKEAGLRGSLKSIARPEFRQVQAVRGVTFSLEPGELLAFIGPNGAGKSTTIKMLTGILYPTSGEAQVLELIPWRDRRRLAYRIGSVFGQRAQRQRVKGKGHLWLSPRRKRSNTIAGIAPARSKSCRPSRC